MTNIVVNGAPHYVDLKTRDGSLVTSVREREAVPQHCPKIFIFAERGVEDEWLGGGFERENMYGAISFDRRSKYFTHQTILANVVNAQGNIAHYKRVVPDDAGPAANYTLWLDLLPTTVDLYERNIDGSIRIQNGEPLIIGTANGFRYKWVVTNDTEVASATQQFGRRSIREGDQFDPANPTVRSTRYPVFERRASSRGAWGNNVGDLFWAVDQRTDSSPDRMVGTERAFPYVMQMKERDTRLNSTKVLPTVNGDQSFMFTLKPGSIDPNTNADIYLGDSFPTNHFNNTPGYPSQPPALDGIVIYQDNINAILTQVFQAELPFIDPEHHDFGTDMSDMYLFNFLSGQTLSGYNYHTYVPVEGGISLNRYETIFAGGGSDGTLSIENFEKKVVEQIRRYSDPNDSIQDKAWNVESIFYDTGFTLPTKLELAAFIAVRGDTYLHLSTFIDGVDTFSNGEELSIAQTLKTRLMNLPESVWFGTSVLRACIWSGDCDLLSMQVGRRVSTTMEVAHKRARYMGASNGRWTNGRQYDQGHPGSIAEITGNFSRMWIPNSVRYRFWDAGLNWWGRVDRSQASAPAFRTVYEYESSVLTADTVALAICELNKCNARSHMAHSGTVGQSDAVFTDRVMTFLRDQVRDRFDNRFPMDAIATVTEADRARGSISWHSGYQIWSDPMRTVATNYTEAFRNQV